MGTLRTLVISLLLFVGCTTLVSDDLPLNRILPVVNATLFADSCLFVQVSLSASLSDSLPKLVDNALVIIESSIGSIDTLIYHGKGCYLSPIKVIPNVTYHCSVEVPGFEAVTASTSVPLSTKIDSVVYNHFAGIDEKGNKLSSFEFTLENQLRSELYWEVGLVAEGEHLVFNYGNNKWETLYFIQKDFSAFMVAGGDSVILNETQPLTLFSNKHIKDRTYTVRLFTQSVFLSLHPDYNHYIELRSISPSYYLFHKQYFLYQTADLESMGSSPQTYPLYSNINNGLGIFSSATISRYLIKERVWED